MWQVGALIFHDLNVEEPSSWEVMLEKLGVRIALGCGHMIRSINHSDMRLARGKRFREPRRRDKGFLQHAFFETNLQLSIIRCCVGTPYFSRYVRVQILRGFLRNSTIGAG